MLKDERLRAVENVGGAWNGWRWFLWSGRGCTSATFLLVKAVD